MSETKTKFAIFLLIALVLGYVAWPSENKPGFRPGSTLENWKLNLGLDLQGGAWFRVRLKGDTLTPEEMSKGTEEAQSILERRVNLRGLKEPRISRVGNEIQIEVPGLKTSQQVEQFKQVILKAGRLEFKVQAEEGQLQAWANGMGPVPEGCQPYEEVDARGKAEGRTYLLRKEPALLGTAIEAARRTSDEMGRPAVSFTLTPEGARIFEKITAANIGKPLAIVLDDRLISAPTIQSKIGREGQITGRFTNQDVQDYVTVLTTGALAAPLEIVGSSFVGPSLGQDAIDRGLKACYFSLIVVMLFMVVYYRHAGMVANIAMLMNVVMMLGALSVLGATLTLPGIAGIVLTMGMAVDANIVIFERMREEKEAGRTAGQCLEAGYDRAWWAIMDANLTTLIIGVVLFYFGTGPIQGFAATLSIGIFTTLFTALACSKTMMKLMVETGMVKEWTMMRALSKPSFPFMKWAPKAAAASAVLIAITAAVYFARGDSKYGIDFRGGVSVQMRVLKPTPIEEIRGGVTSIAGASGPKYPGAEVQSVILGADASGSREAMQFQIRTLVTEELMSKLPAEAGGKEGEKKELDAAATEKLKDELVADLRKQFAGKIPSPAIELGQEKIDAPSPYAGGGTIRIALSEEKPAKETIEKLQKKLKDMAVDKPADAPAHYIKALDAQGKASNPEKASRYEIFLMPGDFATWNRLADQLTAELKEMGYPLSGDPFPSVETVSASIVSELKEKALIALIFSWAAIILYLAVRFDFKYGVAAVVALVHDSVLAVTCTAVVDALLPKSLGIDLSISLTTVAAALTVIGYSVNDTVVIFDRLRENLRELKAKGLAQVIDDSLNQTLSRTIITAVTVFFVVTVLLAVTLTSGGGIAAMSFPMLVGVIVGSYSSLFIATPLLYWWRAKRKVEA